MKIWEASQIKQLNLIIFDFWLHCLDPRLVQLAKPKKNLQKEFSDVERGEDFVPHMHDLSYHMSQLHDTRISATFQQKFDAAIRDLRSLLQIL